MGLLRSSCARALRLTALLALAGVLAPAQQTQQFPAGSVPRGVAFHAARNQLLVTSFGDNSLLIFDLANLSARPRVVTSLNTPVGVAVDDQLGLAVVANSQSNEVSIINLATLQVTRVPVESTPFSVDININTHIAVVSNSNSRTLSLIDLSTGRPVSGGPILDVPVSSDGAQSVAVNNATNIAVAVNTPLNSINLVDLSARRVVSTVTVGPRPVAVAVNPVTNTAVVCNASGNTISIVNLATRAVVEVPIASPQGVAIHAPSNTAIISSTLSNEIVLLDLGSNRVLTRISSVTGPTAAAASSLGLARQAAVVLPPNNNIVLFNLPAASGFAVVNAANFQSYTALGAIVSGFGSGLSNGTQAASSFPLPLTMQGTRVSVGGLRDAPLYFVSPTQVNFQVPTDLSGRQSVDVFRDGRVVLSGSIFIAAASPALFSLTPVVNTTLNTVTSPGVVTVTPASMAGILAGIYLLVGSGTNSEVVRVLSVTDTTFTASFVNAHTRDDRVVGAQAGVGPVAALNPDGSLVSMDGCLAGAKSAAPDSVVALYATGQGALLPALAAGQAAPATPLSETATRPEVRLGGVLVTVEFSGAAPGFAGLWQINIRIPLTPPSGAAVPVVVTIAGQSSTPLNTLAVNTTLQSCRR